MQLKTKLVKKDTNKIAALLTCYNRREKTISCLRNLLRVSLPDDFLLDVYLVDDNSTDGTTEAVNKYFPQVNTIKGNGHLFWNKGMNLAWKSARENDDYDFYLWLNDDVVLHENSIYTLINDFNKTGVQKAIIAGACKSGKGNVTYSGYRSLKQKKQLEPIGDIQQCDYFNGNVVLVPSAVLKEIGYLDSKFHHGQGDFDYGLRAGKKGIISYVSSSYIGICERHGELPKWCNPNYSFAERWENFKSPLGGTPQSIYILHTRHIGRMTGIFHFFTIYLRLFIPSLWVYLKKDEKYFVSKT